MLFLQLYCICHPLVYSKFEIPGGALKQCQLKLSLSHQTFSNSEQYTKIIILLQNVSYFIALSCLYFKQVRVDWVLIIFGTQIIKKKQPVWPVFPDYLSVFCEYEETKDRNKEWMEVSSFKMYYVRLKLIVSNTSRIIQIASVRCITRTRPWT